MYFCKHYIHKISILLLILIFTFQAIAQTPDNKARYNEKINQAEKLFFEKDYTGAKKLFQEARKLDPGERHPVTRITEINRILGIDEEDNVEFIQAVRRADAFYDGQQHEQALEAYIIANDLMPGNERITERILELNRLIRENQALANAYETAMKKGNQFLSNKQLDKAKEEFETALSFNPNSSEAKTRLAEISKVMNEKEQYENAVKEADDLYVEQNYEAAKLAYQRALRIKANENYPQSMIQRIDEMIMKRDGDALAMQKAYDEAIKTGDDLFYNKEYLAAKPMFEQAASLRPTESYPRAKITEIGNLLADLEVMEQQFQQAIAAGDAQFANQAWEASLEEYRRAEKLKPGENYPKIKIKEIAGILAGKTDAEYQSVIAQADDLLAKQSYEQSIAEYQKALHLKPGEEYPRSKITEINALLANFAAADEAYQSAINQGDHLSGIHDYEQAIVEFQKAAALKPEEDYPKKKISEINTILAGIEAVEEAYQSAIAQADLLFGQENYTEALTAFQQASDLKREEVYPKFKIAEINTLLTSLSEADKAYEAALAQAGQLVVEKRYDNAIAAYEQAAGLKPEEIFPKTKIEEVKSILAGIAETNLAYESAIAKGDKLFEENSFDQAIAEYQKASGLKPEEQYPKNKIAEINNLLSGLAETDAAFQSAISLGDQFFEQQNYSQSLAEFQKAANLKPEESYPKTKISDLTALLAEIAEADAAYLSAISAGDQFFEQKNFDQAVVEYQKASGLKPVEVYPKNKISEINSLFASKAETDAAYQTAIAKGDQFFQQQNYTQSLAEFQKAAALKPEETYPSARIAEINAIITEIAELDNAYQAAISLGDQFLQQQNYEQAVAEFQKASNLKPEESYPKTKINELTVLLTELTEKEAAYQSAIAQGDQLLEQKSYNQAIAEFQKAIDLKPEETYPQTKISEINTLLAEMAEADAAYQTAISQGDQLIKEEQFDLAKTEFQKAMELKPEEVYPKTRLADIDNLIAELAQKQQQFDNLITAADFHFDAGNLHEAKSSYKSALEIIPNSKYPQDRIATIDISLRAELERIQKEYNAAIAEADRLFNQKAYDNAINHYTIASGIKPDETYPQTRIAEITKIIEANVVVDVIKSIEIVEANATTKYSFEPVPRQGRRESYIILKAKNMSERDFRVFLNYGKDGTNNGGFVINIPNSTQTRDYIVKVGGQYRWFSEDNNWISLQPEGGNVEVSMIQISQE